MKKKHTVYLRFKVKCVSALKKNKVIKKKKVYLHK